MVVFLNQVNGASFLIYKLIPLQFTRCFTYASNVCRFYFSVPYLHLQSQVYSKRGTEGWCGRGPGGGGGVDGPNLIGC
jgi:hypothetical protein